MANGRKTWKPCNGCGKACTTTMIGNLSAWLCWTCNGGQPRQG